MLKTKYHAISYYSMFFYSYHYVVQSNKKKIKWKQKSKDCPKLYKMIYQFKKSEKFEKNVWSSKGLETIYGLLKAWNSVSP